MKSNQRSDDKAVRALRVVLALRKLLTKKKLTGRRDPAYRIELDSPSILDGEAGRVVSILTENGFGPWLPKKKP